MADLDALRRLAGLHGIQADWYDIWGNRHEVPERTLRTLLAAMHVPAHDDAQVQMSVRDWNGVRMVVLSTLVPLPYIVRVVWSQHSSVASNSYTDDLRISGTFALLGANEFAAFCVTVAVVLFALLMACRVSRVMEEECGSSTTFSSAWKRESMLGSAAKTSRAAPAIVPRSRASRRAGSSTTEPRATLTR